MKPAHVSALESAGHDVIRVKDLLEKGASDSEVIAAARNHERVVVTYDRTDFSDVTGHMGVLLADETMHPRGVRRAVERVERAYADLDSVVEFLSDWA